MYPLRAHTVGHEEGVEPEVEELLLAHHHLGLVVYIHPHVPVQWGALCEHYADVTVVLADLVARWRLQSEIEMVNEGG